MSQTSWPCGFFDLPVEREVRWFNPSIVVVRGTSLLAVRRAYGHPPPLGQNTLSLFSLNGKQIAQRQDIVFLRQYQHEHWEDPRLVVLEDGLFLSCTNFRVSPLYRAHQILVALNKVRHPEVLHPIYGRNAANMDANTGNEKNWTWFDRNNSWHFVYELWPHHVVRTNRGVVAESFVGADVPCPWLFGVMRGGTPPVMLNGLYWSFFHSSIDRREASEPRRRYFMGAYAFEPDAPFRIKAITSTPLLTGSEQDGGILPVVFPGGAIYRDGTWTVVFGVNDLRSGWIDIPHTSLLLNMIEL